MTIMIVDVKEDTFLVESKDICSSVSTTSAESKLVGMYIHALA